MIALLMAAAVAAATPTPTFDLGKDAPLVCTAHFVEEAKIAAAGLKTQKPQVIDVYAEKAKLDPASKLALTNFCTMFDLGAMFVIKQVQEQAQQGRPKPMGHPTDRIASFTR